MTAFVLHCGQPFPFQQSREELLGEILGIVRGETATPHVSVKWRPILVAERLLRANCIPGCLSLRREHDRPPRGVKRGVVGKKALWRISGGRPS